MHYLEKEYNELITKDFNAKKFVEENSIYGVWYWNLETPEEGWTSPSFWEYLGYKYEDEKQTYTEWEKLVFPDDLEMARLNARKHIADPRFTYNIVVRFIHKKGHIVWVRLKSIVIKDELGKPIRWLGIHGDITLNKSPEEEISKTSFFLKAILDSSLDSIMAFESILSKDSYEIIDFKFTLLNEAACETLKYEEKQIKNKTLKSLFPGCFKPLSDLENNSLFDIFKDVVETGEKKTIEYYFNDHGIKEWISNKLVKFENGLVCTFSIITELKRTQLELEEKIEYEVTERREKEEMLLHQSKLASMGEVLNSIAHNWRQPLNTTSLLVSTLNSKLEFEGNLDNEYIEKWSDKVNIQLKYMSQTIDDFRNFFKHDENKKRFNLEKSIYQIVSLLIPELDLHKILVKINCPNEIVLFNFEGQLQQAILNILNNAKDALILNNIKNPQIKIDIKKINIKAEILISDNAGGIENHETFLKIFNPYFTTKVEGTGMGLFIAKTIINKNLNGQIQHFKINNGLSFKITI